MSELSGSAKWISYAYDPRQDLGVFAFRLAFTSHKPLRIHLSADQRYKLYLNGELVGFGPQRGDQKHWFYDSYELPPISEGELSVLVWNFGWMAPMAQHTARTAFFLDSENESLRTPGDWEVAKLDGWSFDMMHSGIGEFYIDVGPGEIISPVDFEECEWHEPHVVSGTENRGDNGGGTPWMLIPRSLPPMLYERREQPPRVRGGFEGDAKGYEEAVLSLPLKLDGPLLLDYEELLCAYPRLSLSGPAGATVAVTYAEALWQTDGDKGDRSSVAGKLMKGYQDRFELSSDVTVELEPLWWRTYRYILLEPSEPVKLEKIEAIETGYPIVEEASFDSNDPDTKQIWDVSVRTAKRCAGETYFDCPYYEQLQYAGDTRIQALIGYYLSRDRRLQRNAIENFSWSIMENGLTQSRYPSRQAQVIPPFTDWWVAMLADSWLYDDFDLSSFVEQARFMKKRDDFWQFGDWVPGWRWGVPPGGGGSTLHQLTHTYAHQLLRLVDGSTESIDMACFTKENGLVRCIDDPDWRPSEHIEAMYRLLQQAVGQSPDPWPTVELETKCTYYFSYYKHLAMKPEDYMSELRPWREMIANGLTTFAENPEPTRSDCHAWSAHPILGFFQIVAGVSSAARSWSETLIAPNPGRLERFDARIAHPAGVLRVALERGRLHVQTPVNARLQWQGRDERLAPGEHTF